MADDIFDPLEEGAEIGSQAEMAGMYAAFADFEKEALYSQRNLSDKYNTDLGDLEPQYEDWMARLSEREDRDVSRDNADYDTRGLFLELNGELPEPGHGPDTYKKPSHPTFSVDSIYSGADGYEGGAWSDDGFVVGNSNFYSPEELGKYFSEVEKGVSLVDDRGKNTQTKQLAERLQDEENGYSYVYSDLEARQRAADLGDRGLGEIAKNKFDPEGDNIFGRILGTVGGGMVGTATALGLAKAGAGIGLAAGGVPGAAIGGVAGWIIGAVGAAIGGMLGDSAAIWVSQGDERDVREDMAMLEAEAFETDFEREEAEMRVADWYNEKNIERFRQNTWTGTVVDIFLGSLPYMASFYTPANQVAGKAISEGMKLSKATKATLSAAGKNADEGMEALLNSITKGSTSSPLAINKMQSQAILNVADRIAVMDKTRTRGQIIGQLMERRFSKNAKALLNAKSTRLGLQGPASLAIQQPSVFAELKNEQLDGVTIGEDGSFRLDDSVFSVGSIARKEASALTAVLVETVGYEYAGKLLKATGIQKALKPIIDKISASAPAKLAGDSGMKKAAERFFNETTLGKSLRGKTALMKELHSKAALGGAFEEFSEEYIEMVTLATLGLDKDDREKQGMSYAENLVDKWFFPVKHPAEAAAMLVSFGIFPAGAAAATALRGDIAKEEYEKELSMAIQAGKFNAEVLTLTNEEREKLVDRIESFAKRNLKTNKSKGIWKHGSLLRTILTPTAANDILSSSIGENFKTLVEVTNIRAREIAKAEGLEAGSQEVMNRALREVVSTRLIGRLAATPEGAKALDAMYKSGDLKPYILKGGRKVYTETRTAGGEKAYSTIYGGEQERLEELAGESEANRKVLEGSNIATITTTEGQRSAVRSRGVKLKSGVFAQLSKKMASGNKKARSQALADAVAYLEKNLGSIQVQDGGPVQPALIKRSYEQLAEQIAREVERNPDTAVFSSPAEIMSFASGQEAAEATGADAGKVQLPQGFNIEGVGIVLTPFHSINDSGARVFEEEALELSYKKKNLGIKLNRRSVKALDEIRQQLRSVAGDKEEAPDRIKKAKAALAELGEEAAEAGSRVEFERYIAVVQALTGEQSERVSGKFKDLVSIISDKSRAAVIDSVSSSFTESNARALAKKMKEGELERSQETERKDVKEKAESSRNQVESFIEGKGRSERKRSEAAAKIRARLKSGEISTEEGVKLAGRILAKLRSKNVPFMRTKADIRALNEAHPDLSYSATSAGFNSFEDLGSVLDEDVEFTDPDGLDREKSQMEKGRQLTLVDRLMAKHHARNGARIIWDIGKAGFLAEVTKSEAAWKAFLQEDENEGTFVKKELRRVANETSKEQPEPVSYDEAYAFMRFRNSLHMYPFFSFVHGHPLSKDGHGPWAKPNIFELNRHQLDDEMLEHATDFFADESRIEEIEDRMRLGYYGSTETRYDFLGDVLGLPGGMLAEIDARLNVSLLGFLYGSQFEKAVGMPLNKAMAGDLETGALFKALKSVVLEEKTVNKDGKKTKQRPFINRLMAGVKEEHRHSPSYTNVAGDSSSAVMGDSHLAEMVDGLIELINSSARWDKEKIPASERDRIISFLDGVDYAQGFAQRSRNRTSDALEGEELASVIRNIFGISSDHLHTKFGSYYLHHMGRFGEKGKMPFVWQRYYGRKVENLRKHAAEVSKRLKDRSKISQEVADMFLDPLELLDSKKADFKGMIESADAADVHYAIHALDLAVLEHGDLQAYIKDGKSAPFNVLNTVARASQELTDGIRFTGENSNLNLILIDDVKILGDMEGFDGQAFLSGTKARQIAAFFGKVLMGGSESADTFKAHISSSPENRTLVKVNWQNIELAADTRVPELERLQAYMQAHPEIDGVVFDSGAKFISGRKTDWLNGAAPELIQYGEGSLIRSQDLSHDNSAFHEGQVARQRTSHMMALNHDAKFIGKNRIYKKAGGNAARIRSAVSLRRLKKKLPEMFKASKLVSDKAPPAIQHSINENGESIFDPRYARHVLEQSFSAIVNALKPVSARVALQKMGEGSLGLTGYVPVDMEGNVVAPENAEAIRVPRARLNIVGARYQMRGFKTRKEAADFIRESHRPGGSYAFFDMFWPDENGLPTKEIMLHEIEEESDGTFTIPGDLVEETRIPSGSYASHTFMRLSEPATENFKQTNISISNEGIRIAKGEDFDGDKGFVLMFYKRINKSVKNGMFEMKDGKLEEINPGGTYNLTNSFMNEQADREESDHSMMNRALSLEHVMWIHPDTYRYYDVSGEMPKSAFDKALIGKAREDSPLLKKMHIGSVEGIAAASTVNYVRQKAIGVEAVYNSMYSMLSSFDEPLDHGEFVIDRRKDAKGNLAITNIPLAGTELGDLKIKEQLSFESYHSVKRLIDTFLNMVLDDHKDPRISFINLNSYTAGISVFLLMHNVNSDTILADNAVMQESEAFEDAVRVMKFLGSPAMMAYTELRKHNARPDIKPMDKHGSPKRMRKYLTTAASAYENQGSYAESKSSDIEFVIMLHAVSNAMFNLTKLSNSGYVSTSGIEGFLDLISAHEALNDGFNGVFETEQANRLFGQKTENAMMQLAHAAYKQMHAAFERSPVGKALRNAYGDELDSLMRDEDFHDTLIKNLSQIDSGIIIGSIRGSLSDDAYVRKMTQKAIGLLSGSQATNPLVRQLVLADGKLSLRNGMRRKDLSNDQVWRMKEAFDALSPEAQEAMAVAAFAQYGMSSSNWTGSWAGFISDAYSKKINEGISKSVERVDTRDKLLAMLESADRKALELASLSGIQLDDEIEIPDAFKVEEKKKPAPAPKKAEKALESPAKPAATKPIAEIAQTWNTLSRGGYRGVRITGGKTVKEGAVWNKASGRIDSSLQSILEVWNDPKLAERWDHAFKTPAELTEFLFEKAYLEGQGEQDGAQKALQNLGLKKFGGTETYSIVGENALNVGFTDLAEKMEAEGKSRREIWDSTSWWRGRGDNKWRFEINDDSLRVVRDSQGRLNQGREELIDEEMGTGTVLPTLGEVIKHRHLFKAYPDLKQVPVQFAPMEGGDFGKYDPVARIITINSDLDASVETRRIIPLALVHEIQHAIQAIEGFVQGTNTTTAMFSQLTDAEMYNDKVDSAIEIMAFWDVKDRSKLTVSETATRRANALAGLSVNIQQQYKTNEATIRNIREHSNEALAKAYEAYRLSPGEIEAFMVSERMKMSPSRRSLEAPWETEERMLREKGFVGPTETVDEAIERNRIPDLTSEDLTYSSSALPSAIASIESVRLPLLTTAQRRGLAGRQLMPPAIAKLLQRFGVPESDDGYALHYNALIAELRELDLEKQLLSSKPETGNYNTRIVKKAVQLMTRAARKVPGIEQLPGDIQVQLALHAQDLSAEVLDLIDSQMFGDAALALVKNTSRPRYQTQLADTLIGYQAMLDSVNAMPKKAPSVYLQSTAAHKRDSYDLYAYATQMDLFSQLEPLGIQIDQLLGSPSQQAWSLTKLEEHGDHQLTAQARKLVRLANGVPTKHELQNGTETEIPPSSETSYSMAVLNELPGMHLPMPHMQNKYGSHLMQDVLLKLSRHAKLSVHQGMTRSNILMRLTAGATWYSDDGTQKIKTDKTGRALGKPVREALTYLTQLFPNGLEAGWRDVQLVRSKDDLVELKKKEGDQRFEVAATAERIGDIIDRYETWRAENAPHLPAMQTEADINAMIEQSSEMFRIQRDLLNESGEGIGEEWISEFTGAGYVNQHYQEDESSLLRDGVRETATQEKHKKYSTYLQAALEAGKIPETLDISYLMRRYSDETARVVRNRATLSSMALVTDEDMLPMILFEGVEKFGVVTEKVAEALSERLEAAMQLVDPEFIFKTDRAQNAFKRLSGMISEINPEALGYVKVETGFKSVRTAWVKKGTPHSVVKHIVGDHKQFQHDFSRIAFESILKLNHTAKSMAIFFSMFHPFALVESFIALDGIGGLQGRGNLILRPFKTYKELRTEYRKGLMNPEYNQEWIQAGLGFDHSRAPDYEYLRQHDTMVKWADMLATGTPLFRPFGLGLKLLAAGKHKTDTMLWEMMLPAMKLYSANKLMEVELERRHEDGKTSNISQLREDIAVYVNDAFGGQEWEKYIWANPRTRKWLHMFWFAPDWTLSALNISGLTHVAGMNRFFKSPTSKLHARNRTDRYWPAFFAIVLMGLPNLIQALIYGFAQATGNGDDDDNLLTFGNERHHKFEVDITPFLRTMSNLTGGLVKDEYGKTKQRRVYLRWGKQAYEVFEGWLGGPESARDTILGKSSVAVKLLQEQVFNQIKPGWETPWADHPFSRSIVAVDGKMWDGRLAGVIKKFLPMSATPFIDEWSTPGSGKPSAFFAPARLGMNSYNAQKEIAEVMRAYVEGGMKANIKGLPKQGDFDTMVSGILDAAELNGYKRKKTLSQGISQARSFYYSQFFEGLERNNSRRMEKAAEALIILETKKSNFKTSVSNRLETQSRKLDAEVNRTISQKWHDGMRRAAEKGRR